MKTAFAFLVIVALFAYVSAQAPSVPDQAATSPSPAPAESSTAPPTTADPGSTPADDASKPNIIVALVEKGKNIAHKAAQAGFGLWKWGPGQFGLAK